MSQPTPESCRLGASRASRGRPKDPDKREAILRAAKALFTAQGMVATSMEAIAQAAGVSKLTVYSHFQNKEELFRQTVLAKCAEHWPEALFDMQTGAPLRDRLRMIGRSFLDLVFGEDVLNVHRILIAEATSKGHFGRLFWQTGPEPIIHSMAQILKAAVAAGELRADNMDRAAANFFVLLKGDLHLRCMLGIASPLSGAALERHLEETVDLFLRAYAPVGGKRAGNGS